MRAMSKRMRKVLYKELPAGGDSEIVPLHEPEIRPHHHQG